MEQPGICKFLIENGADIDELARPYTYTEYVLYEMALLSVLHCGKLRTNCSYYM